MPREYGFRVFTVETYSNRIKDNTPLDVQAGSTTHTELVDLIEHISHRGTHFLDAKQPDDPQDPRIPKVSITLDNPTPISYSIYHFEVCTGEVGGHRWARSEDGVEHEIANASAERGYYATMLFPSDAPATKFLLVLETHKSSDVKSRLFWLLNSVSAHLKREAVKTQEAERERISASGEKPPARKKFSRLLFQVRQVTDSEHFDRVLENAQSASAEFTESAPTDSGGNGRPMKRKLTYRLLDSNEKEAAGAIGKLWASRQNASSRNANLAADGILELAEAIDIDTNELGSYDAVALRIRSAEGFSVTVRPDSTRDMFTYPVSDGQPPEAFYYMKASGKIEELAAKLALNTSPIDIHEVNQCFSDSALPLSSADYQTA